jgi:DNA-binding GntR family transcriptional regulator
MAFERLNHTTLSNQVVREIRRQIFSGVLKPDERVVEAEVAAAMGISRGPVREAFAELEKEGLILTKPRKGTYVKSFSFKDIEEIYTLRAILEGYAVTLAFDRLQENDLNYLRDLLKQITEMAEKKDVIAVARLNMQFHRKILELSDHKRLYDTWQSLLAQTQMLSAMTTEYYTSLIDIRKSHEILLKALVKGGKGHIKKCFEDHILNSMKELIAHLKAMQEKGAFQADSAHRASMDSPVEMQLGEQGKNERRFENVRTKGGDHPSNRQANRGGGRQIIRGERTPERLHAGD